MNQNKSLPIDAIDFRADSYSANGKSIVVSLATKYSAERGVQSADRYTGLAVGLVKYADVLASHEGGKATSS